MTEPAIDTGMILEALNDKVDRDCNNSIPIIPKFTLICTSTVQKDASVTFSDDPANYDFLISLCDTFVMIGKYISNNRVKLNTSWSGKDSYSGTPYEQTYVCDLSRTSDNIFTCWTMAWSSTTSVNYSEISKNMKIYGVKL